jgi:predicted alpha/beta-fold hydrolase
LAHAAYLTLAFMKSAGQEVTFAVMEPIANTSFELPVGWRTGHLQTIRSQFRPGNWPLAALGPQRQILVDLGDGTGDKLSVLVNRSHSPLSTAHGPGARLVVLVHGLSGSAESTYVLSAAHALLRTGFNVARVDLRGAGLSRAHSRNFYHAGRTDDLRSVLARLADEPEATGDGAGRPALGIVGFSLGGNAVIKLLGEPLQGLPPVAGVSVSAPLDLEVGSEYLAQAAFGLYESYILRSLKRDTLGEPADGLARLSDKERAGIQSARGLVDFDNALTAPRNGWRSATEYYRASSSGPFLSTVASPLLVVHSLDDPMVPAGPYEAIDWAAIERGGSVSRAITTRGGHVGFHQKGRRYPWFTSLVIRHLRAHPTAQLGVRPTHEESRTR